MSRHNYRRIKRLAVPDRLLREIGSDEGTPEGALLVLMGELLGRGYLPLDTEHIHRRREYWLLMHHPSFPVLSDGQMIEWATPRIRISNSRILDLSIDPLPYDHVDEPEPPNLVIEVRHIQEPKEKCLPFFTWNGHDCELIERSNDTPWSYVVIELDAEVRTRVIRSHIPERLLCALDDAEREMRRVIRIGMTKEMMQALGKWT